MTDAAERAASEGMRLPGATQPRPLSPPPLIGTGRAGFWLAMVAVCAASGVFFAAVTNGRVALGALYATCIGCAVILFEQGVIAPRLRAWLRRLPLAAGVVGTEIVYVALILIGSALAGTALRLTGMTHDAWRTALVPTPVEIVYSLVVSGTVITINRMRELIGTDVFRNLLLGRYHSPVEEERIFLFLDLVGSTDYARRHGDLRAQAFLGAIFAALADPVRRHRGSIDDYVGDMALVTWPLAAGIAEARCVACVLAFLETIEREAERWRRAFGQVPRFRAALHGGRVVTAEVGLDRHKIAYFGDVVNTTGRLEGLTKTLDAAFLISGDLLDRLPVLPHRVVARDLGAHAVRGRGESLTVFALDAEVAQDGSTRRPVGQDGTAAA